MREMVDSGIEWIGKMPKEWNITKLKYFSDVYSGEMISKEEYIDGGAYSIIGSNGEIGHTNKYNNKTEVITTGRVGTIGTTHIVDQAWITDNALIISMNSLCKKFVFYVIPNLDFQFFSTGTAQPLITASKLRNQIIPCPPFNEQQYISEFLDRECNKINYLISKLQTEVNDLIEYRKSLIFESITYGLNQMNLKGTVSEVWKKIPKHWKLADIKYVFEIVKRIAGKEGYDVISVTQRGLKVKDINNNEGQLADNYSGYQLVYPTDYVMNHMDLLTGWVDCSSMFGVTSPDYRVFRLRNKDKNDLTYYKYVMQCCYMCRIFYSLGQGVSNLGRWRLQTAAFNNFQVPVPPIEEQKEIALYLDDKCLEIDDIVEQKKTQLATLEQYKKSLIYEYVTGKKEVPNE